MEQPTPKEIARIQANVAKMRAAKAPEEDVIAYLQHEDSLAAAAPKHDTTINARNLLRSAGQGATFMFSDEIGKALGVGQGPGGLADRESQKAFQHDHPIADFFAKLGGGVVAPAVAALAAPEALAGAGVAGVASMGAAQGALSGAGEAEGGFNDRLMPAAIGAGAGAVAAPALMGAGKLLGGAAGMLSNRLFPEPAAKKAVARAARGLLDNPAAVASRMDEVNALAPGGSSMASAAVAPETGNPRFLTMARGVGADAKAAASTEAGLSGQNAALKAGRDAIGAKIEALNTNVTVTPQLRAAMSKVSKVLGGQTPEVPAAGPAGFPAPAGLQPTSLTAPPPPSETMGTGDMLDALSRLSVKMRSLDEQGIDATGVTKHDVAEAQRALKDVIYKEVPGFKPLHQQYAKLADETRSVDQLTAQVERSRQNHAGNDAYGTSGGSLGGSLPKGSHSLVVGVLDKLFANKAASADAVNRFVMTPTDSKAVQALIDAAPKPLPAGLRGLLKAATASPVNATRSLLFPSNQ